MSLLGGRRPKLAPYRMDDPQFARLYGAPVSQDALGFPCYMQRTLGYDWANSHRIRAEVGGGTITHIAHPLKGNGSINPGTSYYAKGTAGVIRCRVYPDDGTHRHLPDMSGTPLAQYEWAPAFVDGVSTLPDVVNGGYGTVQIAATGATRTVVAGEILHVVFENIDADPVNNFFSINQYMTLVENRGPLYPLSVVDASSLSGRRAQGTTGAYEWFDNGVVPGGWGNAWIYGPSASLRLSTGEWFGCAGGYEPSNHLTPAFSSAMPIRERFTPNRSMTIKGCQFVAAAEIAGELRVSIHVNGAFVDSQVIAQQTADYRSRFAQSADFGIFPAPRSISFRTAPVVASGADVTITLEPLGASVWRSKASRSGAEAWFKNPHAWSGSRAQHLHSSGWVNTLPRALAVTNTGEWWNWPVRLVVA